MYINNCKWLVELLKSSVHLFLAEAEENYPEYYHCLNEDGTVSDELQSDFYAPGSFIAPGNMFMDDFEIRIDYRSSSSIIAFTFFNFDVYDDEFKMDDDYYHRDPETLYDTIEIEKGSIRVFPFDYDESDEINLSDEFQKQTFQIILLKAINSINEFRERKLEERKGKQLTK